MKVLGYIFIFYVGFYFYRLAEIHKKNKWVFGILGIVVYFTSSILYPLYLKFFSDEILEEFETVKVSFKSFLIGLVSVIVLFQTLSFVWSRKEKKYKNEINNIGNKK